VTGSTVATRALVRVRMAALFLTSTTTSFALFFFHLFLSGAIVRNLLHPFVRELLCHIGNAVK
jgi:hypothetical protein